MTRRAAALALVLSACGGHGASAPAARHVRAHGVELVVEGRTATLHATGALRLAVTSRVAGGRLDAGDADVVLVLGGLGADSETVSASMRMLAGSGRIALCVPGGEDEPGRWARALDGLPDAQRGRILDLSGVDAVRFGHDTLVPVAGAPGGRYGLTGRAAAYHADDLDARAARLGAPAAGERRHLVSWAMPSGLGADGAGIEGADAGDPFLGAFAQRAHLGRGPFAWPFEATGAVRPLAGAPLERADGTRVSPGPAATWTLGPVGFVAPSDVP